MNKLLVIGSTNTDMVIKTSRFPNPGETIIGGTFFVYPGGKGANQAVAAARMGADVTFITKLGNDAFGKEALANFSAEGIESKYIITDNENASGTAMITVNGEGENTIVVAPGANDNLNPEDVEHTAHLFTAQQFLLMQLEVPLATIIAAKNLADNAGLKTILNPAPAVLLPEEILQGLFLITPNETEAELLTGTKVTDEASAAEAAHQLKLQGVQNVIITMGSKGAWVSADGANYMIAAPKVIAIDTTAAGDTFNGALAYALANNQHWRDAVALACKAAALSVTRMGAQASAPTLTEVNQPFIIA